MQWLRAVHALESNAYRINEDLLQTAIAIDQSPDKRLPDGLPNFEKKKAIRQKL